MRYVTKHKLWGRSQLVVGIRGLITDLNEAETALNTMQPGREYKTGDLRAHLEAAIARCQEVAKGMDIYALERKRIKVGLDRERKNLAELLDLAKSIPITQEEKTAVKRKRGGK